MIVIMLLVVCVLAYFYEYISNRSEYKKELLKKIKNKEVLHVEIIEGTYLVIDTNSNDLVIVCRFENNKNIGDHLNIRVPQRMCKRIQTGNVYRFWFDHDLHEIHFDSNIPRAEVSDLTREEIGEDNFRIKTKILKRLTLSP